MKILNWIKLKVKSSIKSTEFKVKLSPSWFSDTFAYVKYSTNGGLTWSKLYNSEENVLSNICYWKIYTIKLSEGTKNSIINRFKTYQDVAAFEEAELKRLKAHNIRIAKRDKERSEMIKRNYN